MARHRHKSPEEIAWAKVRRHITREVDTAFQDAREEVLNEVLDRAQAEFDKALANGTLLEIESKYARIAQDAVKGFSLPVVDGAIAD